MIWRFIVVHNVQDRSWVTEFYDSAAEWWGESWYEGKNLRLARLENVAGSVDMTERTFYDAVLGRWIDEWEPTVILTDAGELA